MAAGASPVWSWPAFWPPAVRIVLIVVVALAVRVVLHQLIARYARVAARRAAAGVGHRSFLGSRRAAAVLAETGALAGERRAQRLSTLASVGRSVVSIVVFFVAALMVLTQLGIDITPVLASAGVLGVALGFGAQNLVKDFLSGAALILEDQLGVGDVVDVGPVIGVVEGVGLRCTQVRDVTGALWYCRNGEILRVANRSRGFSRAILDVEVAPDTDLDRATGVLVDAAVAMQAESPWDELIMDPPTSWGIESISGDRAVVRIVVTTMPGRRDDVARELRRRFVPALHDAGIAVPAPVASALARVGGSTG